MNELSEGIAADMWLDITEHPNYEVSNFGQVRNKKTGLVLTPWISAGYYYIRFGRGKAYRLHRLVAEAFVTNPENKDYVDHINQNKLDNRAENLRWVTRQQNANNIKLYGHNTSGFRGVSLICNGKYQARLKVDGYHVYLGCFDTAEQASLAYEAKRKELYPELY